LLTFILSLATFFFNALLAYCYAKARKFPKDVANVAELAMASPNDGFMGFPVSMIFFGERGMLLMLAHNAALNVYFFTIGMKILGRNNEKEKKPFLQNATRATFKFILNPNILALLIGFALSLLGGLLPSVVDEYLVYIGNVSTPMAMIFIGSSLVSVNLKEVVTNRVVVESSIVKLIIIPAITMGIMWLLPVSPLIKSIVVLGGAFPVAATAAMLAEQENQSAITASMILVLSTIASAGTIPLVINTIGILF
ncbi:MAG: AEC family transporter, partial [Firmicutes bacterium]|nr:AEC family transporter [Bacillota bacterium]